MFLVVSAPMCSIARAVLRCNGCPLTAVSVINKYSTSLSSSQPNADIPSAPHIIVTETADAGLLGEYMLPTLLHAANTLAPPFSVHSSRNAILIPGSAVVYAALVQDESLLCMSRADFFSSQLRPNEAYSCGKLSDSATVLTASFVGKDSIVFFQRLLVFYTLQPWKWSSGGILSENSIMSAPIFRIILFLTYSRQSWNARVADLLAAFWCGGQCISFPECPSRALSILVRCVTFKQVNYVINSSLKGVAHPVLSNSPGPPLHTLGAGEEQASSWEQALYATNLCDAYVMTNVY